MFGDIPLEPEQDELLVKLVEASRNVPRKNRQKFLGIPFDGGFMISHPGLPSEWTPIYLGDVEILERAGLVSVSRQPNSKQIDVLPKGFRYYRFLKEKSGQPVERIQAVVWEYLASESFRRKFPKAYQKWREAENLLWSSDSERQFSTIGHLGREAMQEFASALVMKYNPPGANPDPVNTVARMRAVLEHQAAALGETEKALLDAILPYWETVDDLVQRQEHAGQKKGEPLIWEDVRRVVFQTAIVMFEIAGALERRRK